MSTSREKMQQARELIQAKRYDEARVILRSVNHDMALDWLDKIDKLDPPAIEEPPIGAFIKPSTSPKQRRMKSNTRLIIVLALIVLLVALIVIGTSSFVGKLNAVSTSITSSLLATATGTLPPIPAKLPVDDLNNLIAKCLHDMSDNKGMLNNFQKSLNDSDEKNNFVFIGITSHVYTSDYCNRSEAFQVAWFNYTSNNETLLKNNIDKGLAWSEFLVGWQDSIQGNIDSTATMSAYRTAQPTEIEVTPTP